MQAKLVDAIFKAFSIRAFTPHTHFFKIQTFVTGKSALEIYTSANTSSIIHLCFIIDFCGLKTIFFDGSIVQVLLGGKKKSNLFLLFHWMLLFLQPCTKPELLTHFISYLLNNILRQF